MPRGNDKQAQEAQLHELADQFGEGVGNAEALIIANTANRTGELAEVTSLPVLEEDTSELDLDSLEAPDGAYVVDAAVRGSGRTKGTVVVFEDESGRLQKALVDYSKGEAAGGTRRSSHVQEKGADPKLADQASGSGGASAGGAK
jgi:hypothetical protein